MYATDATRLSGELRHDLSSLGDDLGVQEAMMETWLSYAFFLLHCLKCQQVPYAIKDESLWTGLDSLKHHEAQYFTKCQPPMEASQRSRGPWSVKLFQELTLKAKTNESQKRATQIWVHLAAVAY